MNADTLVAVCCYAGDGHQVIDALSQYLHHECPVIVFSPNDSRADVRYPGVRQQFIGNVGYIGQVSLDRQAAHLRTLLEYDFNYFLINDADSFCLSPELPAYLYAEPDVVWSNVVNDDYVGRPCKTDLPEIALQPPYFLSRKSIERMVAIADKIVMQPARPFIDHYMLQLTVRAGLPYKTFPDGRSFPAWTYQGVAGLPGLSSDLMAGEVRKGAIMIHSVKEKAVVQQLIDAHVAYRKNLP